MKPLEKVRDEVLNAYGYKDMRDFVTQAIRAYDARTPGIMEDIAKEYAKVAVSEVGERIKSDFKL